MDTTTTTSAEVERGFDERVRVGVERWSDSLLANAVPVTPAFSLAFLWYQRDEIGGRPWAAWVLGHIAISLLGAFALFLSR